MRSEEYDQLLIQQSAKIILPIERFSLVLSVPEDEVDGLVRVGRGEVTGQAELVAHHPSDIHRVQR